MLARAAFVVVALIVALGLFRGQPFIEMLIFGIALAVAVVPEALPAVVTISLAIGVQKMVKRNALIRRLPAVETLGSTSVICSDKTGTLTKDEMTVRKIFAAGQMFNVSGAGYAPEGEFSTNGGSPIRPDAGPPSNADWLPPWHRIRTWCNFQPGAGILKGIPPKGRWWSPRPRPGCRKKSSMPKIPGCMKSRFHPKPNA